MHPKLRRKMVGMRQAIETRSDVWGGVPVFSQTRVPVYFFLDFLGEDLNLDEFLTEFDAVAKWQLESFLKHAITAQPGQPNPN